MNKQNLNENWKLRYENLEYDASMCNYISQKENGWYDTNLPCDVHIPLIEKKIMEEPLIADNAYQAEWVEEKSWWFKKEFDMDTCILHQEMVELFMEGLDTEADIFLNGMHLGHHKNTFYPFRKDVKKYLKEHKNVLMVRVTSGLEYYGDNHMGSLKRACSTEKVYHRGDARRSFVRKPQYVYGWDWGPRVASCGIMGDVQLEGYSKAAIRWARSYTEKLDKDSVIRHVIEIENLDQCRTLNGQLLLKILDGQKLVSEVREDLFLKSGNNYIDLHSIIKDSKWWWPNGMGDQSLYTVELSLESNGLQKDYMKYTFGIRIVELCLDRINENEREFAFIINRKKVFAKGANWIPADSIYARVSDEKYDMLLKEAKSANFNMLRIWGGGLYEKEIFYRKCDEYGIMIWQDFMFACAFYPDHLEWFCNEVRKEMDYQTKRLRNHASIVLWCGNNENHWANITWRIDEGTPEFFGGANIYNQIAPEIIRKNCPEVPYWNSSPYGGEIPQCYEMGDDHHWSDCMMSDDMEKRITPEEFDKVTSKFVSEYGYIGPCKKSSIHSYLGSDIIDRNSDIWKMHTNTYEKDTVLAGIAKHYNDDERMDLDSYLLYAGLCQGLMYNYSLEALRIKPYCGGSLFWMYNDCWGEIGWTIIDYYLRRKISYYYVKRAFKPIKLILRAEKERVFVYGINETDESIAVDLLYGYTSFDGAKTDIKTVKIILAAFSKDIVFDFIKGEYDLNKGCIFAKVQKSADIETAVLRTAPFRELTIPTTKLDIKDFVRENENVSFTITSDKYAHSVYFKLNDDVRLSDEFFDLLPGECRKVTIYNCPDNICQINIKAYSILQNTM